MDQPQVINTDAATVGEDNQVLVGYAPDNAYMVRHDTLVRDKEFVTMENEAQLSQVKDKGDHENGAESESVAVDIPLQDVQQHRPKVGRVPRGAKKAPPSGPRGTKALQGRVPVSGRRARPALQGARRFDETPNMGKISRFITSVKSVGNKICGGGPPCNYWASVCITFVLLFIFLFEGTFNYISFDGRCISGAVVPFSNEKGVPFVQTYGYGACEHVLGASTDQRGFFGGSDGEKGYDAKTFKDDNAIWPTMLGAVNVRALLSLGGLDTNYIRNYKEWFRVFSAAWMHASWSHLVTNLVVQIFFLVMIEPYWGSFKLAGAFVLSGITGNMISAILDPCKTSVGSSGAMNGIIGSSIPWILENGRYMSMPLLMLVVTIISILCAFFTDMAGMSDNYAHLGGLFAGVLYGFTFFKGFGMNKYDFKLQSWLMLMVPPFGWCVGSRKRMEYLDKLGNELVDPEDDTITGTLEERKKEAVLRYMLPRRRRLPPWQNNLPTWIVRGVSGVLLITMVLLSSLYLFYPKLYMSYSPPGRIKFTGRTYCKCCTVGEGSSRVRDDAISVFVGSKEPKAEANYFYKFAGKYWCFSDPEETKAFCEVDQR